MTQQPTLFIPHGGGPCFFMDDPRGTWVGMGKFLSDLPASLPEPPKAILIVSGHWETQGFILTGSEHPPLIYDYRGFPPHTYELKYPAPGSPALAKRAAGLLASAGLQTGIDDIRGLDHGAFVPLKVAFPKADVPVVEMSVDRSFDPALHVAAGAALAPLRHEGVLIIGAGMSFHNMRGYGDDRFTAPSIAFDTWLTETMKLDHDSRSARLAQWEAAPMARIVHPDEEHLLPLLVAAGAAQEQGRHIYSENVMKVALSGYRFG